MNIIIQIKSIIIFYIYGFALFICYKYLKSKIPKILFIIILPVLTVLFMIYLYYQNNGRVHIYFVLMMLIGIFSSKVCVKVIKNILKRLNIHQL